MLRSALGPSKHSTAFRRAMASEILILPLRSYSVEQQALAHHTPPPPPPPLSRLKTTKKFLKQLRTEDSKESEKMLKYFRKAGAISVLMVFGSIGYAVYEQNFNDDKDKLVLNKDQMINVPIDLSQDIRYLKRGN